MNMLIDIYIDKTPLWNWDLLDFEILDTMEETVCTIDVPEPLLREWYKESDNESDFDEWYLEYTWDETMDLYDYCVKKGCKPKILFEDEWKQYLKDVEEEYHENC